MCTTSHLLAPPGPLWVANRVNNGVQFAIPPLTPLVKRLVTTLAVAFVVELILTNFMSVDVIGWLALSPSTLGIPTLWQLVTYVLVEPPQAVMSVIIGLLFMWLIMSPFELQFGPRRTLQLALFGTLAASIASVAVGAMLPGSPPLFGSTPIAYAGMAATAHSHGSHGRISLFGAFRMTSNQLLGLLAGLSVLWFLATRDHTQLVASLAALGAGVGYIEWMRRGMRMFSPSPKARRGGMHVVRGGRDSDRPKWLN